MIVTSNAVISSSDININIIIIIIIIANIIITSNVVIIISSDIMNINIIINIITRGKCEIRRDNEDSGIYFYSAQKAPASFVLQLFINK